MGCGASTAATPVKQDAPAKQPATKGMLTDGRSVRWEEPPPNVDEVAEEDAAAQVEEMMEVVGEINGVSTALKSVVTTSKHVEAFEAVEDPAAELYALPAGHVSTALDRPALLAKLFASVDADGDGAIALIEFCALYDTADINNDGVIDAEVTADFGKIDSDGDGGITKAEFIKAKLEEFKLDDDFIFEACCGGDRIRMVEKTKVQEKAAPALEQAIALDSIGTAATESELEKGVQVAAVPAQSAPAPKRLHSFATLTLDIDPLEVELASSINVWGRSVFEQFDTDKNGVLDSKELSRALKALPKTVPTTAPPGAQYESVEEMMDKLDEDGDGTITLAEWLDNLAQCAGLAAALADAVNEAGVVEKFRSFEQQKAKREREIAELEERMASAPPEDAEQITQEMEEYRRQVVSLVRKIEEANANAAARAAEEAAPTFS